MGRVSDRSEVRVGTRRRWLGEAAGALAFSAFAKPGRVAAAESSRAGQPVVGRARFKHSVCFWCFEKLGLDRLAAQAAGMGITSIEVIPPEQWPILKRYGLVCAMTPSHSFLEGWCHKENHALCAAKIREAVDATAAAGFPSVITFSGLRKGMPDDVGLENTVAGLKTVIGHAERKKVTLCLEVLNSRVDQWMIGVPDYMCDKVEWAVEVCRRIGSERMKVLFDIFHVQIMQGDLITRIKQFHPYIGHYHTAGVPGRHEIDQTQEINYPAVMHAIAQTGFTGYVAQEFLPLRDPLQSLREAVKLCDVS
ncbi:MAG: hydroxypyruvate isomerase family protein [Thermoguttaceae bacterium]